MTKHPGTEILDFWTYYHKEREKYAKAWKVCSVMMIIVVSIFRYHLVFYGINYMIPSKRKALQSLLLAYITGIITLYPKL